MLPRDHRERKFTGCRAVCARNTREACRLLAPLFLPACSAQAETDEQGRVLVHFRPKLNVGDPAAFAVTRERPGGVVVTDQSGLILLGTPDGS
jgi:hypothetical protein